MTGRVLIFLSAAALAAPATAQITFDNSAPAAPSQTIQQGSDKLICEKEDTIGTRLGARKVCLTALQWQQKKQEQREDFEKVQRIVNQEPSR